MHGILLFRVGVDSVHISVNHHIQVHWNSPRETVQSYDESLRECPSRLQSLLAQLHPPVPPPPHPPLLRGAGLRVPPPPHPPLLRGAGLRIKLLFRTVPRGHRRHSNQHTEDSVAGKAWHHIQSGGHALQYTPRKLEIHPPTGNLVVIEKPTTVRSLRLARHSASSRWRRRWWDGRRGGAGRGCTSCGGLPLGGATRGCVWST